jgi:8-amino-7-oxononanoate synthase
MGAISKAFVICDGYIAGSEGLIQYLKHTSPGFIFSVGISPSNVAASIAALDIINEHPKYVQTL